MVLGEPSQGFAVWDGHGRRGAISSSADVHAPSQEDRSAGCFLFGLQQVLGPGPASHRFGRGRGRPREIQPSPAGLVDPWHQLVALSVLTFLIWGWNRSSNISTASLAQPCPDGSTRVAPGHLDHVQQQGMAWFDEQKGDILAILNDDINQLERFLDKGANDLLKSVRRLLSLEPCFWRFRGGGPLCRLTHPANRLGLVPIPAKS